MPYDPVLVEPMRQELADAGFTQLKSPEEVESFMTEASGTSFVVVNSVCGCAAGSARPGVRLALEAAARPDRMATVFAGQDLDATAKMRSYVSNYPPSSPSFFLFKDGELVHMVPRHQIEGRPPQEIAEVLTSAFSEFCA